MTIRTDSGPLTKSQARVVVPLTVGPIVAGYTDVMRSVPITLRTGPGATRPDAALNFPDES
jgi:hypothetical protein